MSRHERPDQFCQTPGPWTREHVERSLIEAFRLMPHTRIYAPRGNTLISWSPGLPSRAFDIVAFSGTVLGDASSARRIVLVWARAIATEGEVGGSVANYCEANDLRRSTFDRTRIRSCERIARAKNEADQKDAASAQLSG